MGKGKSGRSAARKNAYPEAEVKINGIEITSYDRLRASKRRIRRKYLDAAAGAAGIGERYGMGLFKQPMRAHHHLPVNHLSKMSIAK